MLRAVARTILDFRIHEQYKRSAKLWTIRIQLTESQAISWKNYYILIAEAPA